MKVDPITFAVIKSGLDSIADDMAYTVVRIARSEIVKDVMDFSAALCAGDGQMVAQAKTIAQHLGAIPEAMASVLAKFEGDLHDGDVVIVSHQDPVQAARLSLTGRDLAGLHLDKPQHGTAITLKPGNPWTELTDWTPEHTALSAESGVNAEVEPEQLGVGLESQ